MVVSISTLNSIISNGLKLLNIVGALWNYRPWFQHGFISHTSKKKNPSLNKKKRPHQTDVANLHMQMRRRHFSGVTSLTHPSDPSEHRLRFRRIGWRFPFSFRIRFNCFVLTRVNLINYQSVPLAIGRSDLAIVNSMPVNRIVPIVINSATLNWIWLLPRFRY